MVDILQARVTLSGSAVVGPSVSTFYSTGTASGFRAALNDLYEGWKIFSPPALTFTVPADGVVLSSVTGEFVDTWADGTATGHTGTHTATSFAQGVGVRLTWITSGITNRRRVRGSTYMVPCVGQVFDSSGTIEPGTRTSMRDLVNGYISDMVTDAVIWTRPIDGAGGKLNQIISGDVPDTVSTLRSRRT